MGRSSKHVLLSMSLLTAIYASGAPELELSNPRTMINVDDVNEVRSNLARSPSFSKFVASTQTRIDDYFATSPDVPQPTDPGGGYTHEQHKKNGIAIYEAGTLYAFTGEPRYANYAKELLTAYSRLYPTLGEHPVERSKYPGRLFWQVLNEAVFLVYSIQGYDMIRSGLDETERENIEVNLFRPLADFLSTGSPNTFNRIHNHAAWAVAGVGATGYVLDDEKYVQLALRGTALDGSAGYFKLVDSLFSPDGYYTEGPYYQRYALMPFVVFARLIEQNQPEREIFEYRNKVLLKAISTCIDLSYNGLFFPFNDAIKDKGLNTVELRYGVAIAYALTGDDQLLQIAQMQNDFVLTADSFRMALAIDEGKSKPFKFRSKLIRDGATGERGALGVLRAGRGFTDQTVVLKATSHGFGHGHFDRLNLMYFDNGNEILSDYGSARFLNIEQKEGGRYLPENTSWAKQTIAHNTVVVDEQSHFDGDWEVADQFFPTVTQFQNDPSLKLVRAFTENPYKNVKLERLIALVDLVTSEFPLVLDLFTVHGKQNHQFDLPVHFEGHHIFTNTKPSSDFVKSQTPLADENGYQHLWLRARHDLDKDEVFSFTWLNSGRFYSIVSKTNTAGSVLFTQLGANDPNFNLRPQQNFIRRIDGTKHAVFLSVLETHGEYNGAAEFTVNNKPEVSNLSYFEVHDYQVIHLETTAKESYYLAFARNADSRQNHSLTIDKSTPRLMWQGIAAIFDDLGNQK